MVGGRDYRASEYNRAVRSRRQPGSAFKPFVYAAALERGWSPVSVLNGLTTIPAQGPEEWIPRNVHGEMPDALTLRQALIESNNRAAVALQQRISTGPVIRVARTAGLRDLPDVPSLALGTGVVSPLELTLAYSTFANGGWAVRPRAIRRVLEADGTVALENPVARERVISAESAFQMVSMLSDVMDRGTGASARALGVGFNVGGKTGTTNEFKDAWFVGFSSSLAAGVWVGYDQPATIGREAYGARVALPIWAEFMREAARVFRPGRFRPPDTLRQVPLCKMSYLQPLEDCPVYTEYFKPGQAAPSRLCPLHSGSLRQRAERAVEGFFSALGRRMKGIFGK
jgi:penicillin-binding protein 1A